MYDAISQRNSPAFNNDMIVHIPSCPSPSQVSTDSASSRHTTRTQNQAWRCLATTKVRRPCSSVPSLSSSYHPSSFLPTPPRLPLCPLLSSRLFFLSPSSSFLRLCPLSSSSLSSSLFTGLKKWVEVGNSGVFRPEMLLPMGLPEDISVIAWGLSLERYASLHGDYRWRGTRHCVGTIVGEVRVIAWGLSLERYASLHGDYRWRGTRHCMGIHRLREFRGRTCILLSP